ncbi:hypothetical protein K523DRAFT_117157 [Schizophyllum commune Tattone D]|nr:hypothetical protein K523DRAFT_117157 [Schizophyllum commune Tattone D]
MVTRLHLLLSSHKFACGIFAQIRGQRLRQIPVATRPAHCLLPARCLLPAHCLFICTYPSIPRSINERRRRWDASIPPKEWPIIDPTHVCRGAATCAHAGLGALRAAPFSDQYTCIACLDLGRMRESSDVCLTRRAHAWPVIRILGSRDVYAWTVISALPLLRHAERIACDSSCGEKSLRFIMRRE